MYVKDATWVQTHSRHLLLHLHGNLCGSWILSVSGFRKLIMSFVGSSVFGIAGIV